MTDTYAADGDGDYGVIYRLREHNAVRPCETCRKPADLYLYTEGEVSTFRCRDHLPDDVHLLEGDA